MVAVDSINWKNIEWKRKLDVGSSPTSRPKNKVNKSYMGTMTKSCFNKININNFHADHFCGYCSKKFKDGEDCFESNPYYRESLIICEKCYDGLGG